MDKVTRCRNRCGCEASHLGLAGHREGTTPDPATDQEIDALVYELYGLTEEEIAIVEAREEARSYVSKRCAG